MRCTVYAISHMQYTKLFFQLKKLKRHLSKRSLNMACWKRRASDMWFLWTPLSQIYTLRERTMINLDRKKNCLNCSYFTLMLNKRKPRKAAHYSQRRKLKFLCRLRTSCLVSFCKSLLAVMFHCWHLLMPEYTCVFFSFQCIVAVGGTKLFFGYFFRLLFF